MMWYPTVNDNADLEFLLTPQCKVRNLSYEFVMRSKNEILRDFKRRLISKSPSHFIAI